MPWEKVRKVLDAGVRRALRGAVRANRAGGVRRRLDRPGAPGRRCPTGAAVAVKIQYPGVDAAIRADLSNAGMILRLAKALAPGLDAKAVAEELKERVLEELDYEYEAQNQRTFSRAYRDHPFIYVPDVITRLSRNRVLVTEYVEGAGLRGGEAARPGGAQPLRRDRVPLLPRLDLPAPALQRRRAPRQLPADWTTAASRSSTSG